MKILITGAAGFIGYHAARRFLGEGHHVAGIDNLNGYYDPRLKKARLAELANDGNFEFTHVDITDRRRMERLFEVQRPEIVIHLAAQAGVRYSIENPHIYAATNLSGFLNVAEGARRTEVRHLIYASSSLATNEPVSLYGATKRATELMANSYAHLFGFAATGLRFFTVYGPWGRPDMAPFRFARAILEGKRIDVYNYGRLRRDFIYIDDAIEGLWRVAARRPPGHHVFDVGTSRPVRLMEFIHAFERSLGSRARKNFLPMQAGDTLSTCANIEDFERFTGFRPRISLVQGVERFVRWYRDYYELGESHRRYRVLSASVGG
jgi:UDP-glucuronate 4-epimerase